MSATPVAAGSDDNGKPVTAKHALILAAIGVVFGDIGTSPLYTLKEVFGGHHPIGITNGNVLGILALIFWSLIIVVTLNLNVSQTPLKT